MANTSRKEQKEVSLDDIKTILFREKVLEERNGRYYLTKAGQVLLGNGAEVRKGDEIHNPYINARKEWDERMGYAVARETKWRQFAYFVIILFAMSLFWNFKQSTQSHIEPYLIAQDEIGTITPLGIPHKIKLEQSATEQQMMVYITALRSFSIDKMVNNRNIDIVSSMTSNNAMGKAAEKMKSQSVDPQPTNVQVTNVQPIPDSNSYQVDWTEINSSTMDAKSRTYWRAILVLKQTKTPDDPIAVANNPFGLIITDLNISPRVAQ